MCAESVRKDKDYCSELDNNICYQLLGTNACNNPAQLPI